MPEYITHIDEANERVQALEDKLGLTKSEFIDNIDTANARITELESRTGKTTTTKAATGGDLSALKTRHRVLCTQLGIEPKFQSECKTAAEYQIQIAKLEARLKGSNLTGKAPAPVVVKPFNATIARFNTGKTTGLEKAVGAAASRSAN